MTMFATISLVLAVAAAVLGFSFTRNFVRRRLGFVEGVHSTVAPLVAGGAAAIAAMPVAWLLPLIGGGTAILFGTSVGAGVAAGARDIRRRLPAG
jgi:hypothetical protein